MKQIIFLIGIICLSVGCKQLDGDANYYLNEDCKTFYEMLEDTIKVNPEKGIHYVCVDTTDCVLNVKYDKAKCDLSWVQSYLDSMSYTVRSQDSIVVVDDSLATDSVFIDSVSKEVEALPVQQETTQEMLAPKTDSLSQDSIAVKDSASVE